MQRLQKQFHALGSDVFITLIAENDFPFEATFNALHTKIDKFEQRFSRFLPDSELTVFNKYAGKEIEVSKEFIDLLSVCIEMAKATNGLYNPFVLPVLQKAGYKGSWPSPQVLAGASDFSERRIVPYTDLKVLGSSAQLPKSTALDFGGIGKGYLLDKLNEYLQPLNLTGYWLSLGGDIVCAGQDINEKAWSIDVQHAMDPEKAVFTFTNKTKAPVFIATSGVTKRRGENWHHIINPKTGQPAETDILVATVTSDTGVKADVYAKTIVIAGEEQAKMLKDSNEIRSFIMQCIDKEPTINI
jgi:thiamine biosynthesis lipoprotein